jgi:hypothetical protein
MVDIDDEILDDNLLLLPSWYAHTSNILSLINAQNVGQK